MLVSVLRSPLQPQAQRVDPFYRMSCTKFNVYKRRTTDVDAILKQTMKHSSGIYVLPTVQMKLYGHHCHDNYASIILHRRHLSVSTHLWFPNCPNLVNSLLPNSHQFAAVTLHTSTYCTIGKSILRQQMSLQH